MQPYGPGLASGEVVLRRSEMIVDTMAVYGAVAIAPWNLPWLKGLSQAFERYRWLSLSLEYRPLVGATKDGSVAVGVDWMSQSTKIELRDGQYHKVGVFDKKAVLACTPNFDTPVWQRVPSMVMPSSRLQSRLWYELGDPGSNAIDFAPAFVAYTSTLEKAGEIWLHYRVQLSGTHSA